MITGLKPNGLDKMSYKLTTRAFQPWWVTSAITLKYAEALFEGMGNHNQ